MKYTVESVKVWGGDKTQKRDEEGYMMMSLTVTGHTGEPIDYKSKEAPEIGHILEGELIEYTSKAGNDRVRLETAETKKRGDKIQDKIVAQWALGQSLMHLPDHQDLDAVTEYAKALIERVNELVQ